MDFILIPGLWLDGSSWSEVTPTLESADFRTHPLTLPGMESHDADRSVVSREDHVATVVKAIDSVEGQVVVVGHSMGAGLGHAAIDARPGRVLRAIYVGGFPSPDGFSSDDFAEVDGEIPVPDWSEFEEDDLVDMDDSARQRFAQSAMPSPARVVTDSQRLSDERRYLVPVTMICTEFTSEMLREWVAEDLDPVVELSRISQVDYVDLPTGHWPQFTKPTELARVILDTVADEV